MIYREHATHGYEKLKRAAMAYLSAVKYGDAPGVYKKDEGEDHPSLYGTYHGSHIFDMFGELHNRSAEELDEWAGIVQARQCGNGYFSNKLQGDSKPRILRAMDPVWHFTRGMIWTLRVLGRRPELSLEFLDPFLDKTTLYNYVKGYDWSNSWAAGNQICALATALMALRDWENVPFVDELMEAAMYPALEELLDDRTGYWGCQLGADLYNGQFGTIHVLPVYFAQGWEYRTLEQSVESTLQCQYPDGSFWPSGSDCPDFDGAYMLYNLWRLTDYKREALEAAARRYLDHALMHCAPDGVGFLLHRSDKTPEQWVSRPHYIWKEGEDTVTEEYRDEDPTRRKLMLDSWFYPLSIALVSGILGDTGYEGPYRLTRLSLHECNVEEGV